MIKCTICQSNKNVVSGAVANLKKELTDSCAEAPKCISCLLLKLKEYLLKTRGVKMKNLLQDAEIIMRLLKEKNIPYQTTEDFEIIIKVDPYNVHPI